MRSKNISINKILLVMKPLNMAGAKQLHKNNSYWLSILSVIFFVSLDTWKQEST